jgi:hypothetical protein
MRSRAAAANPGAGRRADLVAAAWKSGATMVAIAEAARAKSRQTIYDDLKSRALIPATDPKEKTMTAVTVEGFNGVDDDQPGGPLYNAEAEAARLHENLDTEHTRRKDLAAETLGLSGGAQ